MHISHTLTLQVALLRVGANMSKYSRAAFLFELLCEVKLILSLLGIYRSPVSAQPPPHHEIRCTYSLSKEYKLLLRLPQYFSPAERMNFSFPFQHKTR